jgi:hypothetical protein
VSPIPQNRYEKYPFPVQWKIGSPQKDFFAFLIDEGLTAEEWRLADEQVEEKKVRSQQESRGRLFSSYS